MSLFHFAIALEDSAFIDNKDWGEEISVELAYGVDLHPPFGMDLSLDPAMDDDRMDLDLSFDECRFAYDQRPALKDLSLKLPLQAKDALKSHLPFEDRVLP